MHAQSGAPAAAPIVLVMGVSGCGKSTLGQALAQALGAGYLEGDDLHPPRNVALMAAGTPLTDADRHDWLATIAARLAHAAASGQALVAGCSALKRSYRDQLRAACPALHLVHLHGDAALLRQRLQARQGHYMPASLLDSQLQTLELPAPDEQAVGLDIAWPLPRQRDEVLRAVVARGLAGAAAGRARA